MKKERFFRIINDSENRFDIPSGLKLGDRVKHLMSDIDIFGVPRHRVKFRGKTFNLPSCILQEESGRAYIGESFKKPVIGKMKVQRMNIHENGIKVSKTDEINCVLALKLKEELATWTILSDEGNLYYVVHTSARNHRFSQIGVSYQERLPRPGDTFYYHWYKSASSVKGKPYRGQYRGKAGVVKACHHRGSNVYLIVTGEYYNSDDKTYHFVQFKRLRK